MFLFNLSGYNVYRILDMPSKDFLYNKKIAYKVLKVESGGFLSTKINAE